MKGRRVFPRFPPEEDVDREIRAHLKMCVEELIAEGWEPEKARREAGRRFGNERRVRRKCRSIEQRHRNKMRGVQMFRGMVQDLRYGGRTLVKSPVFTLVAVVTLALGIGANTTVFSLVNGVLLSPLPYESPEELVWISETTQTGGTNWVAWANFRDWRAESRNFRALAALNVGSTTVLGGDQPIYTRVANVSQDFWSVFPVRPLAGRMPGPEDHREGGAPVAVISQVLANGVFGEGDAVGSLVEISGVRHEVVGIVPPEWAFPSGTRVWIPAELIPANESRTSHNWQVVGRVTAGVTAEDVAMELDPLTVRLVSPHQGEEGAEWLAAGVSVRPLQDVLVGNTRRPFFLLLGAAAFVLLVACTNLASTLLARGTARARELAVRSAIGASRGRIMRQLLSEAALLATLGGLAGIGLSYAALVGIRATSAGSIPRMENVTMDGRVLFFTMVLVLFTTLAFGFLPAIRARENDQAGTLRTEGRGHSSFKGRMWGTLVSAEVALALILLTGSGLLIRSFNAVLSEDAGFHGEDVVFASVSLSGIKYPDRKNHRVFWDDMLARAEALPGVSGAGIISVQPLNGFLPNGLVHLDGDPSNTGNGGYVVVSPGLFQALDIPVLRGRVFDETDGPNANHVVVVNQSFVDAYWPDVDPIGRRVSAGGMDSFWSADSPVFGTVVGVVGDVRFRALTRAGSPVVYWNYRQRTSRIRSGTNIVLESASGEPSVVAPALRRALEEADPDVAPRIQFMREMVAADVGARRFTLLVMTGFAVIGLLLAALGIFGVVSYAVAQRTHEMGIRLALGATGGSVRSMVLRSAMVPVTLGLLVGVVGAWSLSRIMSGLLYQVTASDPATFLGVTAILLLTGFISCWIPTVRGTRVDPMITMRGD